MNFEFKCNGRLDIGCYGPTNVEHWNGKIEYIQVFDKALKSNVL